MQSGMGLAAGFPEDYAPEDRELLQLELIPGYEKRPFTDPDKNLIGVLLPHLGQLRQMSILLATDTRLAVIEADAPRAYENLLAIQGLADHSLETPCLSSELVSVSIRSIGYGVTNDVFTEDPKLLTDEQLQNLAHHYASSDLSLEVGTQGDKQWFYDLVQRVYTDDGNGDGRLTPEGIKMLSSVLSSAFSTDLTIVQGQEFGNVLGPAMMLGMASRKELTEQYEQMMDTHRAYSMKPLWEKPYVESIDEQISNWPNSKRRKYALICQLMPAMGAVRRTGEKIRSLREGVLVGIALELYKRKHGDWPSSLSELVPTYLPSVPLDRLTGGPVRYAITENGPVVYSVGVDGDDDGGRPPVNAKTGESENYNASPRRYGEGSQTDPANDGDWILWSMPQMD